ncbi:hypothetical protein HOO54_11205 [Bacillus sp. WMMC1349]|uniref:YphA family membrane protein n=1 Tax=Bacillus sp. WMMC1349 TaxID=2736254 RepID=UPI0015518E9D|nr:hypothetical protein [Bacillus sp. WMMC1349]NPC92780.1 hypothetical protein [Bacillus sp. WMMC1349]
MDEFYYFWSMWMMWVLTTFILEKNKTRLLTSAFILLNITLSMYQLKIILFFNVAYLLFYTGGYVLGGYFSLYKSIRRLFIHLTMVFAYGFVFLFALYDPVWFILKPEWLIIMLFVMLTVAFEKRFVNRLVMFTLGMCQGEFLYALVLKKIYADVMVGGFTWLSMCSGGVVLIWGISQYEQLMQYIYQKRKRINKGATKMS